MEIPNLAIETNASSSVDRLCAEGRLILTELFLADKELVSWVERLQVLQSRKGNLRFVEKSQLEYVCLDFGQRTFFRGHKFFKCFLRLKTEEGREDDEECQDHVTEVDS